MSRKMLKITTSQFYFVHLQISITVYDQLRLFILVTEHDCELQRTKYVHTSYFRKSWPWNLKASQRLMDLEAVCPDFLIQFYFVHSQITDSPWLSMTKLWLFRLSNPGLGFRWLPWFFTKRTNTVWRGSSQLKGINHMRTQKIGKMNTENQR